MGGETAEMPGVYTPPDYDLAGFIVGYVDEDAILGAQRVQEGDVLIGIASSGLHTNGYALARRIISDRMHLSVDDPFPGEHATVADVLLRTHRSYLGLLRPVLSSIHAMAHITGGGIPGNLGRALPAQLDAIVETASWEPPNVFRELERAGGVSRAEMFRAFNMGVGMIVIAAPAKAASVLDRAGESGISAWPIGRIVPGSGNVILQ
jgi:phosphoribosylformylglycinamidine cyclo-ligase